MTRRPRGSVRAAAEPGAERARPCVPSRLQPLRPVDHGRHRITQSSDFHRSVAGILAEHPAKLAPEFPVEQLRSDRAEVVLVGIKNALLAERQAPLAIAEYVRRIDERRVWAACRQPLQHLGGPVPAGLDRGAADRARGSRPSMESGAEDAFW